MLKVTSTAVQLNANLIDWFLCSTATLRIQTSDSCVMIKVLQTSKQCVTITYHLTFLWLETSVWVSLQYFYIMFAKIVFTGIRQDKVHTVGVSIMSQYSFTKNTFSHLLFLCLGSFSRQTITRSKRILADSWHCRVPMFANCTWRWRWQLTCSIAF